MSGGFSFALVDDEGGSGGIVKRAGHLLNDGVWHHYVVTYDGSTLASGVTLYEDGVLISGTVERDNLSGTTVNGSSFIIGSTGSAEYFAGSLDEISIYNKTLSASEVSAMYSGGSTVDLSILSSSSNLIGWWRMGDNDTYPNLLDRSISKNHGVMTNMISGSIQSDIP